VTHDFCSFLFTDSEVKGEFRGPLSCGEVTLEVNREVNTTAPVIIDDLVPNLGEEVTPGQTVLSGTSRPLRTRRPRPIPA
jgi:hypothetical protein